MRNEDAAVRCSQELDVYLSRLSPGEHADLETLEDIVRRYMRADLADAMRNARRSGAKEEREACARVCEAEARAQNAACLSLKADALRKKDRGESYTVHLDGSHIAGTKENTAQRLADRIRSRSTTTEGKSDEQT